MATDLTAATRRRRTARSPRGAGDRTSGLRVAGRAPRALYVLSVALFAASFAPGAVVSIVGAESSSSALTVLLAVGLLVFGTVSGVVGSVVLDVLLMLALRVAGADPTLRQASRRLDPALLPLSVGVLAAAGFVTFQGATAALASPVVSLLMAVAVLGHFAVLFVGVRPFVGGSVGVRAVALACYVVVPAGVILAAQVMLPGA